MRIKLSWMLLLIAVFALTGAGVLYLRSRDPVEDVFASAYIENNFDADVAGAIDLLREGLSAKVVSRVEAEDKAVAIVFSGVGDIAVAEAVLDLVERYGIRASFFVSGQEAAEYPRIAAKIREIGLGLGSYTLYGEKHRDALTSYEMVDDFVYSARLLGRASEEEPEWLLCNNSRYTGELLAAAGASGFPYVVQPTVVLGYQSFADYETTYNYIRRQPDGSILEIKLEGVLDEEEAALSVKRQDVGADAGIKGNEEILALGEKERILLVVRWICEAILEDGRETVLLAYSPETELPPDPNGQTHYGAEATEEAAKLLAANGGKRAVPVRPGLSPGKALSYSFYGLTNRDALENTLRRLRDLSATGTFYGTYAELRNYPDAVAAILDSGHRVGMTLPPPGDSAEACAALLETRAFLAERFGVRADMVLPPYGESGPAVEEAVSAAGMTLTGTDVLAATSLHRMETDAAAVAESRLGAGMSGLGYGDNVAVRLDLYENSDTLPAELIGLMERRGDELLRFGEARERNSGYAAVAMNSVHTTERALSYVFYGLGNEAATYDALARMREIGGSGTFFVTIEEMTDAPEMVARIVAAGHELGVVLRLGEDADFYDAFSELSRIRALADQEFHTAVSLAMLPYATPEREVREAVSAAGMSLVSPTFAAVRGVDEYATSASRILKDIFGESATPLMRGEIVGFRLDFYQSSNTLAGELMKEIKRKYIDPVAYPYDSTDGSPYAIVPVGRILYGSGAYRYPVLSGQPALTPGQLAGKSRDEVMDVLSDRYIGNPDINAVTNLPGFTREEILRLNTIGRIKATVPNTVFLTFDDWGDDRQVNQLLHVLRKHDVKASFFIRTNYVASNPNLLRAIAEEGHDLGSHTVNHMTLANYKPSSRTYESITEEDAVRLETELVNSYADLVEVAGDVLNEKGRPAVRPYFRAPTLAMSYPGMRAVFDSGYSYLISGDFSTGDYAGTSAGDILDTLQNGLVFDGFVRHIQPGSIIVMHVSPTAPYTAEAVDLFLTQNAKQPESRRLNFARLSDYLG